MGVSSHQSGPFFPFRYAEVNNFEGLIVDRSDWNSVYNHDYDDGVSFVGNTTTRLMQYSYNEVIDALRAKMKAKQVRADRAANAR